MWLIWYESYEWVSTPMSRMNRSRSKFINFIEICNASLCFFQISTSIIQKFLTNRFNIFANITCLCQWCTINLSKWNVQEISQSLKYIFLYFILGELCEQTFIIWVFPEPVGPKTRIFDFSKSKSSTSSSTSFDALSENNFRGHAAGSYSRLGSKLRFSGENSRENQFYRAAMYLPGGCSLLQYPPDGRSPGYD